MSVSPANCNSYEGGTHSKLHLQHTIQRAAQRKTNDDNDSAFSSAVSVAVVWKLVTVPVFNSSSRSIQIEVVLE
jgi:hypothetical protein